MLTFLRQNSNFRFKLVNYIILAFFRNNQEPNLFAYFSYVRRYTYLHSDNDQEWSSRIILPWKAFSLDVRICTYRHIYTSPFQNQSIDNPLFHRDYRDSGSLSYNVQSANACDKCLQISFFWSRSYLWVSFLQLLLRHQNLSSPHQLSASDNFNFSRETENPSQFQNSQIPLWKKIHHFLSLLLCVFSSCDRPSDGATHVFSMYYCISLYSASPFFASFCYLWKCCR